MIEKTYIEETIDRAFDGLDIMLGTNKRARLDDGRNGNLPLHRTNQQSILAMVNKEGGESPLFILEQRVEQVF